MLPETVAELAQHKKIVGLKDATGDMHRLEQTQKLVASDFLMLSGDDASSMQFLKLGGHGVISVTANIMPNAIASMCKAALAGDFDKAEAFNHMAAELHEALFIEPNPVMPKWALYKMGLIKSPYLRLPMVLPELDSKKDIEEVMQNAGIL
jgi:4-hydroxy-tetrahydrodipicolinate synthase